MIYLKIQTNRMLLKKLLEQFPVAIQKGEIPIAPRPLPKTVFKYYYAVAGVEAEGSNYFMLQKVRNCTLLSKAEFEEERKTIKCCWSVE